MLTGKQLQALDELGMVWGSRYERQWEEGYRHAKEYSAENGNLKVPASFCCEDGYALDRKSVV